MCTCVHVYMCICVYTYAHIHIHMYTYTHIHTYIYTYIDTYVHTYIHIHTYGGESFVWTPPCPESNGCNLLQPISRLSSFTKKTHSFTPRYIIFTMPVVALPLCIYTHIIYHTVLHRPIVPHTRALYHYIFAVCHCTPPPYRSHTNFMPSPIPPYIISDRPLFFDFGFIRLSKFHFQFDMALRFSCSIRVALQKLGSGPIRAHKGA